MPVYEGGSLRKEMATFEMDSIIFLSESTKHGVFSLPLKNLTK